MAKIALAYGHRELEFNYDPAQWDVLVPPQSGLEPLTKNDILVAMANPIDGQPLEEILDIGERIVVVVSDNTRTTGSERVLPLLFGRLIECGIRATDISILFATGIHRQPTEEEKRALLTDTIYQSINHFQHDANNRAEIVDLGVTRFDTPVEINRRLVEADHVILTGSIGYHYFAGFTGGRKSVLPGLASARAIEKNHLLALDFTAGAARRRNGVGPGRLDGNAVHEDMQQACSLLAPSYLINTILNEEREIVQIFCGDWLTAHRRGCAEYADRHSAKIKEKREIVIASCGGWPKDINMIQAHKAIDMAVSALQEGGDLILLAECEDGLGRNDFLQWFQPGSAQAMAERLRTNYQVNGQTAWSLATKAERFRITVVSKLSKEVLTHLGLQAASDLESALSELVPDRSGYIIPNATEVIPIVVKLVEQPSAQKVR